MVQIGFHYRTNINNKMKKVKYLILILFLSNIYLSSQKIPRNVIGSGGSPISDGIIKINGTVSQPAIGRLAYQSGIHGVGFWYSSKQIIDNSESGVTIVIPNLEAEIGSKITIPILIEYSKNLIKSGAKKFEIKISYNGTVLYPIGMDPLCKKDTDECSIVLNGSIKDTIGIIASIDFIVKLGNSDSSMMVIEYFRWSDANNIKVITRDGKIDLLGICRAGETIRLIKRGNPTALLSCFPNPASDNTSIDYILNEAGETEIYLIDDVGRKAISLLYNESKPGKYTLNAVLKNIPAGSYFIILKTHSEILTKRLIITR